MKRALLFLGLLLCSTSLMAKNVCPSTDALMESKFDRAVHGRSGYIVYGALMAPATKEKEWGLSALGIKAASADEAIQMLNDAVKAKRTRQLAPECDTNLRGCICHYEVDVSNGGELITHKMSAFSILE